MKYFGDSFDILEARRNTKRESKLVLYVKNNLENENYSDEDIHDIAWALVQFVSMGYEISENTINLSITAVKASKF
jgi:hypothetical protein